MFAIDILESAWLLYFAGLYLFHGEEYIYWPAVCLNWCLVEHSPVKTQRHLLVRLFLTHLLSRKSPQPPTPPKKVLVPVLARMFTMSSFSFCVRKFRTLRPPPPSFSHPSGVCVKCTLPWFFFIQYSVTCLCKFGLEKNKSFYETICPGNCSMASALLILWSRDNNNTVK